VVGIGRAGRPTAKSLKLNADVLHLLMESLRATDAVSHGEVTSITAPDRKKAETVSREHSESPCATVRFGETSTYFRVGIKPGRARNGAAFGLRSILFATG
jgi:hypothetical protein